MNTFVYFPVVFVRIGTLPTTYIDALITDGTELMKATTFLLESETLKKHYSSVFCKWLSLEIEKNSPVVKPILRQFRANLLCEQPLKKKEIEKLFDILSVDACLEFKHCLQTYQSLASAAENAKVAFYNNYERTILDNFEKVMEASQNDFFQNALSLASPKLLMQLHQLEQQKIKTWNKKEVQTITNLLKYLTRHITKTSPFSYFTAVGAAHLGNTKELYLDVEGLSRQVALNRKLVWKMVEKVFLGEIKVDADAVVFVNPTLQTTPTEFQFFWNCGVNKDFFQSIERNLFLDTVIEFARKYTSWNEFFFRLSTEIDAPAQELRATLYYLWQVGLIGINCNWLLNRANWFDQIPPQTDEYMLKVQQFYEAFKASTRPYERLEVLKQANDWSENTVYEDVFVKISNSLPIEFYYRWVGHLHELFERCNWEFFRSGKRQKSAIFFKETYGSHATISATLFYEAYSKFEKISESVPLIYNNDVFNEAMDIKEGVVFLRKDQLCVHPNYPKKDIYCEALVQTTHSENGDLYAVLNNYGRSAGKLIGRFAHLLEDAIFDNLNSFYNCGDAKVCYAACTDGSLHNANISPFSPPYEIVLPNNFPRFPQAIQLRLKDLFIRLNDEGFLSLWDAGLGKLVRVVDNDLQHFSGRAAFYQWLVTWSNWELPSLDGIRSEINKKAAIQVTEGIVFQPRIVYENTIVIQRKRWILDISKENFLRDERLSNHLFFLKLHEWLEVNNIPQQCYVVRSTVRNPNNDEHKPLYINFQVPLFVRLFRKLIKTMSQQIILTECLPSPSSYWKVNGQKHVVESWLQWKV